MNALLTALLLILGFAITSFVPIYGASAVLMCVTLAFFAAIPIYRSKVDSQFLLRIFVSALLVRMMLGAIIFQLNLQEFFGGDAFIYDENGYALLRVWQDEVQFKRYLDTKVTGWGMLYIVLAVYAAVGRNMLAIQFVSAVAGALTAPVIYLCAQHIFQNQSVARLSAFLIAFYPSLVLWTSQGLKDGFIIFLLAVSMLATLKLGEKLSAKYLILLVCSLLCLLSLRFYIFYMMVAAIAAAFIIGMQSVTTQSLARQFLIMISLGLAMTYVGVLRTASMQYEEYGSLKKVQRSRVDLATRAQSGFAEDVDVSTTSGAIRMIPIGVSYLMFAPFPWQLASLRQSITLPEMIIWWGAFPLLVLGLWFALKYRLRQVLPILIFTTMLTLAYAVFQGNVGTAYRQRSQLLIFYFIFVAVGFMLLKERSEDQQQEALAAKQAALARRSMQKA